MFINLLSSFERRGFFFFFVLFCLVFYIFRFHHISEEVCVLICFLGLFLFFSFYLTKKAIINLKKTWYAWFIEGFDLFNVSLVYTCYALLLLVSNKSTFDLSKFFSFFSGFLDNIYMFISSKFSGWNVLFEDLLLGYYLKVSRIVDVNVLTMSSFLPFLIENK